jgi:hypothetical protein
MGINPDAGGTLPTTRLLRFLRRRAGRPTHRGGPPDPSRRKPPPRGILRRGIAALRGVLRTANQIAEEWSRQAAAWWYERRGYIVLFDRHYFADFYAHDVAGGRERPLLRRLHGFLLRTLYPRPDLTILLDAPAAVLFARKPEGSQQVVEARRREYLELTGRLERVVVVNADQPADRVTSDVIEAIRGFARGREAGA